MARAEAESTAEREPLPLPPPGGPAPPSAPADGEIERIPSRPPADETLRPREELPDEPPSPAAGALSEGTGDVAEGSGRRRWEGDWPPSASASASAPLPGFLADRESGESARAAHRGDGPASAASNESEASRPRPPRRVDYAQRHEPSQGSPRKPASRDDWAAKRADLIPSWERDRYAAYPTIGTRMGLGDGGALLGRLTKIFGVGAILALAVALLILAPNFLGGIVPPPAPTPSPTPAVTARPTPTATPEPTPTPEPEAVTHRVQAGETLFGIALRYERTLEQILAANPGISDPNMIQEGWLIIIPPADFEVPVTPAPGP
jgi:hypothetical protein